MRLAQIQMRVQNYLLGDGSSPAAPVVLLAGHEETHAGATPAERLQVYRHGYRARLREVMGSIYERLWAYLGDEQFDLLSAHFIERFPSAKKNLRDYGSGFSGLLTDLLPNDPEVAELAVMEWYLHNAFDTPDATSLSLTELNQLEEQDWSSAHFAFHSSVALAMFHWNSSDIWHALDQGEIPPAAEKLANPLPYVFWRCGLRTHFRPLSKAEYLALSIQISGASFSEACDLLARHHPDSVAHIGEWLRYWISNEMITGVDKSR
jgi:hypothetical protein